MSNFGDLPEDKDFLDEPNINNNSHVIDIQEDTVFRTLGATINKLHENMEKMTQNIMSKLDTMSSRIEQLEGCVDDLVEKAKEIEQNPNTKIQSTDNDPESRTHNSNN